MSDAWMPFQPAIEEPSNAWPDSNLSLSNTLAGHGYVLLLAPRVGEAQVDELDFLVLDELQDICWTGGHLQHSPRFVRLPHAGVGDDPMISHFRAMSGVSEGTDY